MKQTKICSKCKKKLPLSSFYKSKNNKDGLDYYCIKCKKESKLKILKKNILNKPSISKYKVCSKCKVKYSSDNFYQF